MPPKAKFSSESVVDAAFSVVRRAGWAALSARSIAEELGASTGPVYAYQSSMAEIEAAVVEKAMDLFTRYLSAPRTGDPWIDHGIGYVSFAIDEPQLFRCINDERHTPVQRKIGRKIWESLGRDLQNHPQFNALDDKGMADLRRARWMLIHGMAFLLNMGWFEMDAENRLKFDGKQPLRVEDLIRELSDTLYRGIKETPKNSDASR